MVNNETAKSTYVVTSGVNTFTIGFAYNTNPDGSPQIKVYKNKMSNLPLIYGQDYTLSLDGLSVVVSADLAVGDRIDIIRDIPMVQLSDYIIGRIDPEQIETDFDQAVMRDQQLKADMQFTAEVPLDHEERIQECEDDISEIEALVPTQATSSNKLADKDFVNSSIATSTATFKGTYASLAELEEVTADNNDYGFVVSTDAAGNTVYSRYKYNGTTWVFEYNLNNSSFTAEQWAAINSGITQSTVQTLTEAANNIIGSVDADIVGVLTATSNGDVSGFSYSNYLRFPGALNMSNANSFEFVFAFTTSADFTAGGIINPISSVGTASDPFGLIVVNKNLEFFVNKSGQTSLTGTTTLQSNTKYYAKVAYDGTDYILSLSTDGANWSIEDSITAVALPGISLAEYVLGRYDTQHQGISILHMSECYIKKDGILVWQGLGSPGLHQRASGKHEVVKFVLPSVSNNYHWARVYADGWVEQGGPEWTQNTSITFPVEMADTNYTLVGPGFYIANAGEQIVSKSTTGFSTGSNTNLTANYGWLVYGMAATN